jgi:hypothetical protein
VRGRNPRHVWRTAHNRGRFFNSDRRQRHEAWLRRL